MDGLTPVTSPSTQSKTPTPSPPLSALAGDLKDPNLEQEGNKTIVKREACLKFGGKYDGYITSGADETEGDEEGIGHP